MSLQLTLLWPLSDHWFETRDGNPLAKALFSRHYSKYHYKDGRDPDRFVGPGERIVLLTAEANALFVWRKFRDASDQRGINCSVFRNESSMLSSTLILEAEEIANRRWPGERFYTYVAPTKIRSSNPGYCFQRAGWVKCGITKKRKILILEKQL